METIKLLAVGGKTIASDLDLKGFRQMGLWAKSFSDFYPRSPTSITTQEMSEKISALVAKESISVLVIDIDNRDIEPLSLISSLANRSLGVMIVGTSVDLSHTQQTNGCGADLFVEQPLARKDFVKKIRGLLDQKSRSTERVTVSGWVEFSYDNSRHRCQIGDISISGILLTTSIEFELGTRVKMRIFFSGGRLPLEVSGEFVRVATDNRKGIGVRFIDLTNQQLEILTDFVRSHSKEDLEMIYY